MLNRKFTNVAILLGCVFVVATIVQMLPRRAQAGGVVQGRLAREIRSLFAENVGNLTQVGGPFRRTLILTDFIVSTIDGSQTSEIVFSVGPDVNNQTDIARFTFYSATPPLSYHLESGLPVQAGQILWARRVRGQRDPAIKVCGYLFLPVAAGQAGPMP